MKHYHKITILLAFAILAFVVCAQSQPHPQTTTKKEISKGRTRMRVEKVNVTQRPQAPTRQNIDCIYDGEIIAFDFVLPDGECDVVITEYVSADEQSYIIDSSDCYAEIYVGQLYESTVTLTTERGVVYTCELTAE